MLTRMSRGGGGADAPCDADAVERKHADTPTLRMGGEDRRRWKKSIALLRFFPRPDVTRHPPTRRPGRRGDGRRRSTALRDADAEREGGGSAALMRSCAAALLCLVWGGVRGRRVARWGRGDGGGSSAPDPGAGVASERPRGRIRPACPDSSELIRARPPHSPVGGTTRTSSDEGSRCGIRAFSI